MLSRKRTEEKVRLGTFYLLADTHINQNNSMKTLQKHWLNINLSRGKQKKFLKTFIVKLTRMFKGY